MEKNLSIIKKIAWSYHKTTGLEYEDLLQEGAFGYLYWSQRHPHNPDKSKLSTFIWCVVQSHLKNYAKTQNKMKFLSIEDLQWDKAVNSNFMFEELSSEAQEIVKITLGSKKFANMDPLEAQRKIMRILAAKGWKLDKILYGIKELKKSLQ